MISKPISLCLCPQLLAMLYCAFLLNLSNEFFFSTARRRSKRICKITRCGAKNGFTFGTASIEQRARRSFAFWQYAHRLKSKIKHCNVCHNISDDQTCSICIAVKRDKETICVVEDTRDVMAIENTNQYFGVYHVLGGLISPMDGIGPSDLFVDTLVQRVATTPVKRSYWP